MRTQIHNSWFICFAKFGVAARTASCKYLQGMNEFGAAFGVALTGTLKVFAMGFCGWWFLRRGWLPASTLQPLGQLIAFLTLPCLVFYRFATRFDPQEFPDWPKYALIGGAITLGGLLSGSLAFAAPSMITTKPR